MMSLDMLAGSAGEPLEVSFCSGGVESKICLYVGMSSTEYYDA